MMLIRRSVATQLNQSSRVQSHSLVPMMLLTMVSLLDYIIILGLTRKSDLYNLLYLLIYLYKGRLPWFDFMEEFQGNMF
jgi:hypothetical protein